MANGSKHSLYAIAEAAIGTTPTGALTHIRITGCTLGLSKDPLQSEEIRSDRQISDFRQGANQVQGDINFEMSYGSFDALMEGAFMGRWVTGSAAANTPPVGVDRLSCGVQQKGFTFVRHFSDISDKPYHLFRGCEIASISFTITANAMVTGTMSIVGRGMETLTQAQFTAKNLTIPSSSSTTTPVDSFTGVLREGGNPIAAVTEITLSLDNGLESRFVVGSKDSIGPEVGRSNLTGNVSVYFENSVMLDKFLNETESSLQFEMPDAAGNKLIFNVPRLKYTGGQPDVGGEGSILLPMPFQALLDDTTKTNFYIDRDPV